MFIKNILKWAEKKGYRADVSGIDLLRKVNDELERRQTSREIDPTFYAENLSPFLAFEKIEMSHSGALIVVAVPRPAHIVSFEYDDGILEMVLPPTYVGYRKLFETLAHDLETNVFGGQVELRTASIPLKTLAGLLGIVSYGKNNLTYIPEFGSYFQLVAYLADTPLLTAASPLEAEPEMMSECTNCSACQRVCPMGAISPNRFLLHAENCYTLFSESPQPLSPGIHPPTLNAILGCMECQRVCPMNRRRLKYENTKILFSSEETRAILDSNHRNSRLQKTIKTKFEALNLSEGMDIIGRNVRNFLKISGRS